MNDFLQYLFLCTLIGVLLIIGIAIGAEHMYSCVNKEVCTQSCQTLECYTICRKLEPISFERQVKYMGDKQVLNQQKDINPQQ